MIMSLIIMTFLIDLSSDIHVSMGNLVVGLTEFSRLNAGPE